MKVYSASKNAFFAGEFKSRYVEAGNWPDDAVKVSDEVYAEYSGRAPEGKRRAAGADGLPVWEDVPAPELSDVEASCLQAIDIKASEVRDRFITSGVGQSAVYMRKLEEARAYKKATDPVASDYPRLDAEATRRGMTMTALTDEVIARNSDWTTPEAQIEAERVGGKDDVRAASTTADKRTAADNAIATLDGIRPA